MTPRHIALVVAAVAVLGLTVYLYLAVHATSPAVANVRPEPARSEPSAEDHGEVGAREPDQKTSEQVARADVRPRLNRALRDVAEAPGAASHQVVLDQPDATPGAGIDIKKDELMASANKAYDHGEFDEAMMIAKKVLATDPANTRMLRIMISASCILDDAATAQRNYSMLPPNGADRADMRKRCDRYGVSFTES